MAKSKPTSIGFDLHNMPENFRRELASVMLWFRADWTFRAVVVADVLDDATIGATWKTFLPPLKRIAVDLLMPGAGRQVRMDAGGMLCSRLNPGSQWKEFVQPLRRPLRWRAWWPYPKDELKWARVEKDGRWIWIGENAWYGENVGNLFLPHPLYFQKKTPAKDRG